MVFSFLVDLGLLHLLLYLLNLLWKTQLALSLVPSTSATGYCEPCFAIGEDHLWQKNRSNSRDLNDFALETGFFLRGFYINRGKDILGRTAKTSTIGPRSFKENHRNHGCELGSRTRQGNARKNRVLREWKHGAGTGRKGRGWTQE